MRDCLSTPDECPQWIQRRRRRLLLLLLYYYYLVVDAVLLYTIRARNVVEVLAEFRVLPVVDSLARWWTNVEAWWHAQSFWSDVVRCLVGGRHPAHEFTGVWFHRTKIDHLPWPGGVHHQHEEFIEDAEYLLEVHICWICRLLPVTLLHSAVKVTRDYQAYTVRSKCEQMILGLLFSSTDLTTKNNEIMTKPKLPEKNKWRKIEFGKLVKKKQSNILQLELLNATNCALHSRAFHPPWRMETRQPPSSGA